MALFSKKTKVQLKSVDSLSSQAATAASLLKYYVTFGPYTIGGLAADINLAGDHSGGSHHFRDCSHHWLRCTLLVVAQDKPRLRPVY